MNQNEMLFESVQASYIYSFYLEWNEGFFIRRPLGPVKKLISRLGTSLSRPIIDLFDDNETLLFNRSDFKREFIKKIKEQNDDISQYLNKKFSKETIKLLNKYKNGFSDSHICECLAGDLNKLLSKPDLFSEQPFEKLNLTEGTKTLCKTNLHNEDLIRRNRLLLEEAYRDEIAKRGWNPMLVYAVKDEIKCLTWFENVKAERIGSANDYFRPIFRHFTIAKDSNGQFDHVMFRPGNEDQCLKEMYIKKEKPQKKKQHEPPKKLTIEYSEVSDPKAHIYKIEFDISRRIRVGADGIGNYTVTLSVRSVKDREKGSKSRTSGAYKSKDLYALVNLPIRFKLGDETQVSHKLKIGDSSCCTISEMFWNDIQRFVKSINEALWHQVWELGRTSKYLEDEGKNLLKYFDVTESPIPFVNLSDRDIVPPQGRRFEAGADNLGEFKFYQLPSVYLVVQPKGLNKGEDVPRWIERVHNKKEGKKKNWKVFTNILLNMRDGIESHLDLPYVRENIFLLKNIPYIRKTISHDAVPNVLLNKNIYTMRGSSLRLTLINRRQESNGDLTP